MKHKLSEEQKIQKLKCSILKAKDVRQLEEKDLRELMSLDERISCLLNVVNKTVRPASNMLFFVMYDISSTKVRSLVAKYLIRKGCVRIQRSIFLADVSSAVYEEIRKDLVEVQAAYDNEDSILLVPISEGYLDAMRIIGQQLDMDVIMHRKNTLFF